MQILKIDHLGIAVNSMGEGKKFWTDVLGLEFAGDEVVAEQKVNTGFFPVGESEVELLESTAPDGPVAKFIEKKGTGFQHVAFRVSNIDEALKELKTKGIKLIDENPVSVQEAHASPSCIRRPRGGSWWSYANGVRRIPGP